MTYTLTIYERHIILSDGTTWCGFETTGRKDFRISRALRLCQAAGCPVKVSYE